MIYPRTERKASWTVILTFFLHHLVIFPCLLWAQERLTQLLKVGISFVLVIIAWEGNRDAWNEVLRKVEVNV